MFMMYQLLGRSPWAAEAAKSWYNLNMMLMMSTLMIMLKVKPNKTNETDVRRDDDNSYEMKLM